MDYIDLHADTLTEITSGDLTKNTADIDLSRIREQFRHYTQVFAIWKDQAKVDKSRREEVFMQTYQRAGALLADAGEEIALCKSFAEMEAAWKSGKAAAFLSIEDLSFMGNYAAKAAELGFCFAMLTWNYVNEYGCGAAKSNKTHLTPLGKQMVSELTAQGIILDLSHLSDGGVEDVLELTDRAVIASHSDVRKICGQPRNLTDTHIRELIRRKGLIGMNLYRDFVGADRQVDLRMLFSHMDAVLELGGEDVLAFGCDFDGCEGHFPEQITGVESMSFLQREMEAAGFDQKLQQKIFSGNAYAFLKRNL